MAEKRIILQTGNKNRLKLIREKLDLQEKSFVSSTLFDKRLFLNKHAKFAKPRSNENGNKNTKYSVARNLPQIIGANATVMNLSQSKDDPLKRTTAPKEPKILGRKNDMNAIFSKKQTKEPKSSPLLSSHTSDNQKPRLKTKTESTWEALSPVRSHFETTQKHSKNLVRSKQYMVDEGYKTVVNMKKASFVNFNDINRNDEKEPRRDKRGAENVPPVEKKTESVIQRSSKVTSGEIFINVQNTWATKPKIVVNQQPRLSTTSVDSLTDTCKIRRGVDLESGNNISKENDKVKLRSKGETSSSQVTITRRDSWRRPSESLPALERLRRGSYCDVKTFTSGRVLDFLAKEPSETKPKRFLDVDTDMLKYCRYLRTPVNWDGQENSALDDIPEKLKPSKNIIIGHTKITSLL